MKSNIDIIKKNVKEVVKETINGTKDDIADKVIAKLKAENLLRNELTYYRKVEILLTNLNTLKDAVRQKEEDIEYLEKYGLPEKSKSIVVFSSSSGTSGGDRYVEIKEKYIKEKIETERDIRRIENALNKIKKDKYYNILRLRYLNDEENKIYSDEEIAEKLEKDRSTISRNRKRLINKLVTILFPQSMMDLI